MAHEPPRPLRVGELFDVMSGRFIRSIDEATGPVRQLAGQARCCMACGRLINVGDDYEDDFVIVCMRCVRQYDVHHIQSPTERASSSIRARVMQCMRQYGRKLTTFFHINPRTNT